MLNGEPYVVAPPTGSTAAKTFRQACAFALLSAFVHCQPVFAGGVEDYLYEWSQMQKTDPNGFYLMVGGISLMVFLSLTIFAGFIYYLYKCKFD